ncbi:MAG: cobalt-zinc-cadmium efflux system outer membrane protein [Akkermansiaceae bacterium]|jgi:cobalt-zinc-cadmium efflux system outer membrane protein
MQKSRPISKDGLFRSEKLDSYPALRLATVAGTVLLLAACQAFERRPLDPVTHNERWKAQGASDDKVHAFAKRLTRTTSGASPFNPVDGVSLNEGKIIALVYNPDLRIARLKAGVAKATADHAGLWNDPKFSLNVLKFTEGVPDPWVVGSALSLTIPLSGRLRAEKSRAEAAMHAVLDRVAEAEWKVTIDLQKSWVSWSAQRTELAQTRKIVEALNTIVKSTTLLAEQGEIPRTEAALFTIEQTSRRLEITRLEGEVEAQEQEIRSLLGLSPNAPIRLLPDFSLPDWQPSEDRLAKNNPTLNRLRSEYEVSERTLFREIRKQYPDLTIGPQAESDEGQTRLGFIGAIPLPILNANKGGIATARAEREVAQAEFETEYERKVGQLAVLLARLSAIKAQRVTMENTLIPLVDRQTSDARNLVDLGEGGSLVLLESIVRAHDAKLQVIDLQRQRARVESEIQFLLGPTNHKSNFKKD